jgi:hypothetical protein
MPRIKLIMLGLVAILVTSAMVAGPASATTKNEFFEFPAKTKVTTATEVVGTVGTAELQGEVASAKILIECTKNVLGKSEIEAKGESKGSIKYESCTLYELKEGEKIKESNCTVEIPEFKFKDQLVEGTGSGQVEDEFKPATGTTFVEIKITGSLCSGLKGTFKVEGTIIVEIFLPFRGFPRIIIYFQPTGSKLTFNGKPAGFFNTTELTLKSGKEVYAE